MTQEEKSILLKDLSARLSYGVKIKIRGGTIRTVRAVDVVEGIVHFVEPDSISPFGVHIEGPMDFRQKVKPYLRPMSSMTEEEYKEYDKATELDVADSGETLKANLKAKSRVRVSKWYHGNDWLNAHHFDYRGLIPMGLALEAPAGMYDIPSQKKRIPIGEHVMYLNEEYVVEDNSDHYILWCVRKDSSVPLVHLNFEDEEYLILKKD